MVLGQDGQDRLKSANAQHLYLQALNTPARATHRHSWALSKICIGIAMATTAWQRTERATVTHPQDGVAAHLGNTPCVAFLLEKFKSRVGTYWTIEKAQSFSCCVALCLSHGLHLVLTINRRVMDKLISDSRI